MNGFSMFQPLPNRQVEICFKSIMQLPPVISDYCQLFMVNHDVRQRGSALVYDTLQELSGTCLLLEVFQNGIHGHPVRSPWNRDASKKLNGFAEFKSLNFQDTLCKIPAPKPYNARTICWDDLEGETNHENSDSRGRVNFDKQPIPKRIRFRISQIPQDRCLIFIPTFG